MADPGEPDPYIDDNLRNPGEPLPDGARPFNPEPDPELPEEPEVAECPQGQVPPEEQSDG
ncbi:hypothetical protein [Pseudomonas cremoricolorata]|uniref:Uncharacterized protein n=1 Tax=Pseudomonas cremoricolorata TaxID=157783 RepID=A0A089WQZ0_9PSED|nr:hypothetical protein [Pseudomonas cremoricolorata]AIR91001.1 hypothetical protein LK03_17770 [Pseudomonas cremoricolorata]